MFAARTATQAIATQPTDGIWMIRYMARRLRATVVHEHHPLTEQRLILKNH